MPEVKQEDLEDGFRESLADVEKIIEKLSPFCTSPAELLEIVRLGKKSDGQLRLLIATVTSSPAQSKK